MQVCFFEDKSASRFHPLTLTRPVDDLRIGILTIKEKWLRDLQPENWSRMIRPEFKGVFSRPALETTKPCVWINSRILPTETFIKQINKLGENSCITKDGMMAAARTNPSVTETWVEKGEPDIHSLLTVELEDEMRFISHLWDLFLMNEQEITADISRIKVASIIRDDFSPQAILENPKHIHIDKNAIIEPGAVLIAREGPVFIGEKATIQAGAIIRGPAAVCHHSTVKMAAKICKASTIGPFCKVNGEINNSIIHSYSNKAHEGYLGNSLIGQWCNFGADTNVSNLKNNYGTIRITDWQSQKKTDTRQQFLGTVMGDHTKTAINTHLNTGTMCGVSCNIFTTDFPPTFIPSYSWVGTHTIQPYRLDKALETMHRMMHRRAVPFTDAYAELMKYIFEFTI